MSSLNFGESNLFQPLKINDKVTLSHRVVLAPLTRLRVLDTEKSNINIPLVREYYSQRSAREGTLIISEAVRISRETRPGPVWFDGMPVFLGENIEDWREIVSKVHNNKSFFFFQLWFGLNGGPETQYEFINEATEDKLDEILQIFVKATGEALELGADGVEIHFANSFTLSHFLNPAVNHRNDEYGGSIEKNATYLLKLLDSVGEKHGYDKVGVRISPYHREANETLDTDILTNYAYFVSQLEKRRAKGQQLAYIHAVEPRVQIQADDSKPDVEDPFQLHENIEFLPSIWNGPIIRAGNFVNDRVKTLRAVEHPRTALAFGRYFISNPDLPDRLEKTQKLNPYKREFFYTSDEVGYTDYQVFGESSSTN